MRRTAISVLLALLATVIFAQPSFAQTKTLTGQLAAYLKQQVTPYFITNRVDVPLGGLLTEVGFDYIVISGSTENVMPISAIGFVRVNRWVPPASAPDPKKTFSQKLTDYLNQKRQLQVLFITDQVQHSVDGFIVDVGPDYVVLQSSSTDIVPFAAIGFVRPH